MNARIILATGLMAMIATTATVQASNCAGFNGWSVELQAAYKQQQAKGTRTTTKGTATVTGNYTTEKFVNQTQFQTDYAAFSVITDRISGDSTSVLGDTTNFADTAVGSGDPLAQGTATAGALDTDVSNLYSGLAGAANTMGITLTRPVVASINPITAAPNSVVAITPMTINGAVPSEITQADYKAAPTTQSAALNAAVFQDAVEGNALSEEQLDSLALARLGSDTYTTQSATVNMAPTDTQLLAVQNAVNDGMTTFAGISQTVKTNKSKMDFTLSIAYGHNFNKFYVGGQLFAGMSPGKTTILPGVSATAPSLKTYRVGLSGVTYSTALPPVAMQVTMKEKFAFGAGIKLGFTEGSWLFYAPFNVSMTKYTLAASQNTPAAGYTTEENPTPATLSEATTYNVVANDETGQAAYTAPAQYQITGVTTTGTLPTAAFANTSTNKTKFGYSFGLGTAVKLSENFSLDLCWTYAPTTKITVNTKAYQTPVLTDANQFGTKTTFKTSSQKIALGVIWHI